LVAALLIVPLAGCGTRVTTEEINSAERGDVGLDHSLLSAAAAPATGAVTADNAAQPGAPDAGGPAVATRVNAPKGATTASAHAPAASALSDRASGTRAPVASKGTRPAAPAACTGSDAPIAIGQVGAFSGLIGAAVGGARTGLALWAQSVNTTGGIQCHPVKIYAMDDGSSPSQAAADAEDLIQNKKVIAVVGVAQPIVLDATRSVTSKAGIPIVGGDLFGLAWNTDPLLFPQGTSAISSFAVGLQAAAESVKATKAGVLYCVEASICSALNEHFDGIAKAAGVQPVFKQSMSLTQTSFTSNCQNAKAAGAQVLYLGMEGASMARVANSCASIGYNPVIAAPGLAVPASIESNTQLQKNGVYLGAAVAPFDANLTPAQKAFRAAVDRFANGASIDQNAMQGWVAGKLFEAALNQVGAALRTRAATTADVLDGLYTLPKNETLEGLSPPLNYTKGQPAPNIGCGFSVALLKGGFTAPVGNKRIGNCPAPTP
jgi:branched-chain amino acid transport system substrate-binding protein